MRLGLGRWWTAVVERAAASALALTWRVLGALLLGILLARWSWILFAPHAAATASVAERGVAAQSALLFGATVAQAPQAELVALPNVKLVGVYAAKQGGASFAVLSQDGKQTGLAVGEKLASGAKLVEVQADYVLFENAGVQHRVNLEEPVPEPAAIVGKH